MTSTRLPSPKNLFVYIVPPSTCEMVLAGRLEIDTQVAAENTSRFEYEHSYVSRPDAVPLDPVELYTVSEGTFMSRHGNALFGALRDATPDAWGRAVIDRILCDTASEIGYLLQSPDDRMGAVVFGQSRLPPPPKTHFNSFTDLERLMKVADAIHEGSVANVDLLQRFATSMGGARPKTVVELEGSLWLAKFSKPNDRYDVARIEHATMRLAAECGIDVAHTRTISIGERSILLVKRFDRELTDRGWLRHRMVSALTVIQGAENEHSNWSYVRLADRIRQFGSAEGRDRAQLFRRIAFNMLVNNDDDHPRNTAMISDANQGWRLSPAYDLVPKPVLSQERYLAMEVGIAGRIATRQNLLSQCQRFGLNIPTAEAIVEEIRSIIERRWYDIFRESGVPEADCEAVRGAMLNPGFEWKAEPA
ncbi:MULTISPECIES: type II toxin-antitoxin system HipA family toxin [unclassified Mesorhizobium]|uniref:type II toxin-antitoxin system HipA family toxin n=1 Tax=unclassified Mesorhizobium TaxID=325217 RepID=UPI0030149EAC